MPILAREPDLSPGDLLERDALGEDQDGGGWWALYTMSRHEKDLMRRLRSHDIPFYGPMIPRRGKTPAGRVYTSFVPLFPNYVFIHGDEFCRFDAVSLGGVSRYMKVAAGAELTTDLRQIWRLIDAGVPLTPESRLSPGRRVRVRRGPFRDFEGVILRREGQTRLLVAVNYLQQGASMVLEDCEVEVLR